MPLELTQEPPYYEIVDGPAPSGTKYYTALLNQTGTNAPVATVLQNTLTGTPVWTRTGQGEYLCTLAGQFTLNKTLITIGSAVQNYDAAIIMSLLGLNSFPVYTYYNGDDLNYDDSLVNTPIKIEVYP